MQFVVNAASWVVGKALSPIGDGFLEAWAASNGLGPNTKSLKLQLLHARAVLNNAQGRELNNPALKELLLQLRGLAYNADDVLDELEYFRIQDELLGTHHAATDTDGCSHALVLNARHTIRALKSKLKLPSSSRRLKFDRVAISGKMMDIVEQLKQVCDKVSPVLNLEPQRTIDINAMHRPQTTPVTIEPQLYGRDVQLRDIVDGITYGKYSGHKLTVLPIVGPGGIGKTTFTQNVYQKVKSQFDVTIWICVSLNFNANRLAHDILKQIPKVYGEKSNASQEELIEQRLKSKRLLLVLDDIWKYDEDEWKKLIAPFGKGECKGNIVMVTTRFPEVTEQVKSRDDCLIELGRLEQADLLEFFGACVFGQEQLWKGHDEFKEVGRQIVERLKGSPLAAKTVGRLLRRQPIQQWTRVLANREWEQQTSDSDIMPALTLSYHYLPFHLQQCFSYCALFPEDYEFDGAELIHLWIGLDILHSVNQNKSIEDVGHCCLQGLVNYGFLKENKRDNGCPYYVLHDLLHDLAVKVSSEECVGICGSNVRSIQIPASVRHLSITIDEEVVKDRLTFEQYKEKFNALGKRLKVETLRTLMFFGEYQECLFNTFCDLFKEATALRIVLCKASYNVEDLLPNLSKLVHLRYLRIKQGISGASTLPGSISRLYQLKIVDAQECSGTSKLSRDITNLRNLQYFLVSDDSLHSGIVEVGKLEHLRELRRFEVKKRIDDSSEKRKTDGFELKQLGKMHELQVLGIYNLGNIAVKEEASEVNVIHKDRLQELTLDWGIEGTKQPTEEDGILECLNPHSSLQKLCIRRHGGAKCPTWLGADLSVKHLEYLCLDDVAWEDLPSLGGVHMLNESGETRPSQQFMNLRRLELVNVQNLKKWVGIGSCHLFSHLEVLIIRGCKQLSELSFLDPTCNQLEKAENMALFSSLKELEIEDCPILSHLPSVPWTRSPCSAKIQKVDSCFEAINYTYDFKLEIQGKNSALDSMFWKVLEFDNLSGLKELSTKNCPALPLDHLLKLSSLKKLTICASNTTVCLVENESNLRYKCPVEYIKIEWCNTNGKELTQLLSYCPELSSLIIGHCNKIRGLSVAEQPTTSTASSSTRRKVLGWLMSCLSALSTWYYQPQQQQQVEAKGEEEEIHAASAVADTDGLLLLPPQLEELEISFCDELTLNTKAAGGLQGLRCLRSLAIWRCPLFLSSFSVFPSSFSVFPSSLQYLELWDLRAAELCLSNLTSLTELKIGRCGSLRVEGGFWPFLAHSRLIKLSVWQSPNFFVGCERPPPGSSSNLDSMNTDDIAEVLTAPICTFLSSSLTNLTVNFYLRDIQERFTEEQEEAFQLLTSLRVLWFWDCPRLHLPASLHTLPNLKTLLIHGLHGFQSLPKGCLPSSLQLLQIDMCGGIQSLPEDVLPSSLKVLQIFRCGAIRSLPKVDSLPSSLRVLDVQQNSSDEIRRQCQKLRGIIPIVRISESMLHDLPYTFSYIL